MCLPIWLTGCAGSNEPVAPSLPAVPAGLAACVAESIPSIPGAPGTALTKAQAATALADQRASALAKDRCAQAWQAFYGALTAR